MRELQRTIDSLRGCRTAVSVKVACGELREGFRLGWAANPPAYSRYGSNHRRYRDVSYVIGRQPSGHSSGREPKNKTMTCL